MPNYLSSCSLNISEAHPLITQFLHISGFLEEFHTKASEVGPHRNSNLHLMKLKYTAD